MTSEHARQVDELYARISRLESENAALRKRVEELEGVSNPALEGLERVGWPCRLQELPDLYSKLAAEFLGMKARAEKAERERDAQAEYIAGCDAAMEALQERAEKAEAESLAARNLGQAHLDRAERAERELNYEQERNRLNVQQWSEENAKLQADLDALRATSAELDADRLRKHEELHRVKADLDAALDFTLWLRDVTRRPRLHLDAEQEDPEPYPGNAVEDRVLALLEKRREENRG